MRLRSNKNTKEPFDKNDTCPITLENINELYTKNYKSVIRMSDNIFYSKKALQRWLDEIEYMDYSFILPSRKPFTDKDLKQLCGKKRKRTEQTLDDDDHFLF